DSKIFPNAYIGDDVTIGNNCTIHPGVKIYRECRLGNNVIVHAGTIIGSDGFGFAPQPDGSFKKVPQIGNVVIEDQVEIGANATIDRGTIGSTLTISRAQLDNLLQIAHSVQLRNDSVLVAQTVFLGSTNVV